VITGLRKDKFGLLLAVEEDGKLKPGGVMEFMTPDAKKVFYNQYRDLIVDENKKFTFIEPKIKCRVKFRNYTKSGLLRIPSFVEYIS
jgi:DNA ligase 1